MPYDAREFFSSPESGAVHSVRDRQRIAQGLKEIAEEAKPRTSADALSRAAARHNAGLPPEPVGPLSPVAEYYAAQHEQEQAARKARDPAEAAEQQRRRQAQIDRDALDQKRAKFLESERSLNALYILKEATDAEKSEVNNLAAEAGKFGDLSFHEATLQSLRWRKK